MWTYTLIRQDQQGWLATAITQPIRGLEDAVRGLGPRDCPGLLAANLDLSNTNALVSQKSSLTQSSRIGHLTRTQTE